MPFKSLELKGRVFGRLKVIDKLVNRDKFRQVQWVCKCECGNESVVTSARLMSGKSQSCGCLAANMLIKRSTKHGHNKRGKRTTEYRIWVNMRYRCYDEGYILFKNYGGRGITVCDRWLNSFDNFLSDVGMRPSKNHSLDRYPNNDGNYEPGNVRWATNDEQSRNKRNNRWIEFNGKRMILKDWADYLKTTPPLLYVMIKKYSFEYAHNFYTQKQ